MRKSISLLFLLLFIITPSKGSDRDLEEQNNLTKLISKKTLEVSIRDLILKTNNHIQGFINNNNLEWNGCYQNALVVKKEKSSSSDSSDSETAKRPSSDKKEKKKSEKSLKKSKKDKSFRKEELNLKGSANSYITKDQIKKASEIALDSSEFSYFVTNFILNSDKDTHCFLKSKKKSADGQKLLQQANRVVAMYFLDEMMVQNPKSSNVERMLHRMHLETNLDILSNSRMHQNTNLDFLNNSGGQVSPELYFDMFKRNWELFVEQFKPNNFPTASSESEVSFESFLSEEFKANTMPNLDSLSLDIMNKIQAMKTTFPCLMLADDLLTQEKIKKIISDLNSDTILDDHLTIIPAYPNQTHWIDSMVKHFSKIGATEDTIKKFCNLKHALMIQVTSVANQALTHYLSGFYDKKSYVHPRSKILFELSCARANENPQSKQHFFSFYFDRIAKDLLDDIEMAIKTPVTVSTTSTTTTIPSKTPKAEKTISRSTSRKKVKLSKSSKNDKSKKDEEKQISQNKSEKPFPLFKATFKISIRAF